MDKVIIYRSRTEAEIDNLLWNSHGAVLEVFVALGIWVGVFWFLYNGYEKSPSVRKFITKHNLLHYHINKFIFAISLPITYVLYKLFFILLMYI